MYRRGWGMWIWGGGGWGAVMTFFLSWRGWVTLAVQINFFFHPRTHHLQLLLCLPSSRIFPLSSPRPLELEVNHPIQYLPNRLELGSIINRALFVIGIKESSVSKLINMCSSIDDYQLHVSYIIKWEICIFFPFSFVQSQVPCRVCLNQ